MAQNNKSGTSLNISEYSLKERQFFATIAQVNTIIDEEDSSFLSTTLTLQTSLEQSFKIKSVSWTQNYGVLLSNLSTDNLSFTFERFSSEEITTKITAVVTLYDNSTYVVSRMLTNITSTSEEAEVPAFTCTPTGFQADFSDFVVTPNNHYLSYEFTTDTGSVIPGSTRIDSYIIEDNAYDINGIVEYLLLTIQIEDPETFEYLNLANHFNVTVGNNILYVDGNDGNSAGNPPYYLSYNYRSSFKIITAFDGELPEVDVGQYILNQKDVSELEIFSCSRRVGL